MISHRLIVSAAAVTALTISLIPLTPGTISPVQAGTPLESGESPAAGASEATKVQVAGKDGVTNPVLIDKSKVLPTYPEVARKSKIMGHVILQAMIDRDGRVRDIEVVNVEPKGNKEFADSAIKAVKQWRYEPARLDGAPVDVYFTIRIEFKLDGHKAPDEKDPAKAGGPIT